MDKPGNNKPNHGIVLALVSLGGCALYLMTISRCHTWDAIAYASAIHGNELLSGRYLSTTFYHPHHLIFNAIGYVVARIWEVMFKNQTNHFLPLQIMSSIFGAASILLVGKIIYKRTGDIRKSCFLAAMFALSHTVWWFSTEVEVMLPAMFFSLLALNAAINPRIGSRDILVISISTSVAILIHQINFFFFVAIALLLFLRVRRGQIRSSRLLAFAGYMTFFVLGTYMIVGVVTQHLRSPLEFLGWVLAVRTRSTFEITSVYSLMRKGADSYVRAFISLFGPTELRFYGASVSSLLFFAGSLLSLVGLLAMHVSVLLSVKRFLKDREPFVLLNLIWLVLVAVFILWFSSANVEFWIYAIPPVIFLFSVGGRGLGRFDSIRRRFEKPAYIAFLILLGTTNFRTSIGIRMNESNAEYRQAVDMVKENMSPGDLILSESPGRSALGTYGVIAVPYFTGVDVVVLPGAETSIPPLIEETIRNGNRVYILEEVVRPEFSPILDPYSLEELRAPGGWKVFRVMPATGGKK